MQYKSKRRYTVYCKQFGIAIMETDDITAAARYVKKHRTKTLTFLVYDNELHTCETAKIKAGIPKF